MAGWGDNDATVTSEGWGEGDKPVEARETKPVGWGETALDVAKQVPSGLMAGLAHANIPFTNIPLARAGQAQLEVENMSGLPAPKAEDYSAASHQALPEPISAPGRAVRAIGESIPTAVATGTALPSPGSLGLLGASVGAQQAVGERAGPWAGLAAGLAVPSVYGGARAALAHHFHYKGSPTFDELDRSADSRWEGMRERGIQMNPTEVSEAIGKIKKNIDVAPENAPDTFGFLSRAETKHAPTPPRTTAEQLGLVEPAAKEKVDFDKLYSVRRDINDVWKKAKFEGKGEGPEANAARQAIRGIDEFMGGHFPELRAAQQESAAKFRMEAVQNLFTRAENAARAGTTNIERAYKTELKNFVQPNVHGKSRAEKEGFNSAEREEIKEASKIGHLPGILRMLGTMGGYAGGAVGLGMEVHTGDPKWLALAALGYGSRQMHGAIMRARANNLRKMVGARSPLGEAAGAAPSSTLGLPGAGTATNVIRSAPTQQMFAKGGRVKRSFSWRV